MARTRVHDEVRTVGAPSGAWGVRSGPAGGLLLLCWFATGLLLLTFLWQEFGASTVNEYFDLRSDQGYAEYFFFVATLWTVLLAALLGVRTRSPILGTWAVAFAVLAADDRFMLHETFGAPISRYLGVRHAAGELVWLALLGVVVGAVLVVAHLRSEGLSRAVSEHLFVLSAGLLFCGVMLDGLHSLVEDAGGSISGGPLDTFLVVLEDGGEIVLISLVMCFLFAVTFCGHRPSPVPRPWRRRHV